ncbi:receptor 12 [Olea europaea subsp. europaea]|uniref:Receptor 12 n=1 Tax=Olea europaea subsp. europaea TaxID=158383 RepID=A0A8S0QTM4_OLEEU|nr:receptor 12 [Olea europaea subsp. europaea]
MEGNSFYKFYTSSYHFYLDTYVDNALLQWKGRESEYRKLGILKGIDLSSNKIVGTIPRQFSDLRGFVFLNLSRNHLTGNIISSIGQMEMLEWLDLSRNKLSGKIPNSLAELHFLNILDLSYNNLTGMIPLDTQLQSFNTLHILGIANSVGFLWQCPRDSPYPSSIDHGKGNNIEEDDEFISREFYIHMTFGSLI